MSTGRVLVTGATGIVGRQTLSPFVASGFEVHAVSRSSPPKIAAGVPVAWHSVDLLESGAFPELMARAQPTHLLHLAWCTEPGVFWTSPENARWERASLALLEAFAASGGQRAVLVGSCAEYDWNREDGNPWRESDPCRPATPYGQAKHALGRAAMAFAEREGLSLAWARLFLMFGPGEDERRLLPSIVLALLRGKEAQCSSGRYIRDFSDTRDVAAALVSLVAAEYAIGPVNVASGRATSIAELARLLADMVGRPELLRLGALPDRSGEPPFMVADVSRLKEEIGFTPTHTLTERLADCIAGYRKAQ
ncbi:MAG TPA: NAD(P)-dependent oxidoreductase [Stellaceae bacterium]|nr:NAD(P)-dependent oxidoreductase [Stellaceae bacterium]